MARCGVTAQNFGTIPSICETRISMKKKSATDMPTVMIVGRRRIVEWTITKKTIFERIITPRTKERKGQSSLRLTRR
jgi:precorrin-3B methylase